MEKPAHAIEDLGARLHTVLDAAIPVGCQHGRQTYVTVRQLLAETPAFLLIATVSAAALLI